MMALSYGMASRGDGTRDEVCGVVDRGEPERDGARSGTLGASGVEGDTWITTQIQTNAAILAMRESRAEGSRNRRSHADAGRADVAFLSVDALGAIVVLG